MSSSLLLNQDATNCPSKGGVSKVGALGVGSDHIGGGHGTDRRYTEED
jgi:hypothetical protein